MKAADGESKQPQKSSKASPTLGTLLRSITASSGPLATACVFPAAPTLYPIPLPPSFESIRQRFTLVHLGTVPTQV